MPIYEYECTSCAYETEVLQKFSDPLLTVCERCGKETFQKKMSMPSFSLKGSGWYADGYGSSKSDKTASAETKPADTALKPAEKSPSSGPAPVA